MIRLITNHLLSEVRRVSPRIKYSGIDRNSMRVAILGLGDIGRLVARCALKRGYSVVGGVDIDPAKIGADVGELAGVGRVGKQVYGSLEELMRKEDFDVLIQSTTSYLDQAYRQFRPAVEKGISIVSTCETLVYPYYRYPELAGEIDRVARHSGAAVLGAGINPGYLLDVLPVFMTAPCLSVESIVAVRQLDAAKRRLPFRKKVGVGMRLEEYSEKLRRGEYTGHVGMAESALLIAKALKIRVDGVEEDQVPVVADRTFESAGIIVKPGEVRGVESRCVVRSAGREAVRLEFRALVGAEEYEEVTIRGEPSITWRSSGTPGDLGTVSVILNVAPLVLRAGPGLLTIDELPLMHSVFRPAQP